MAATVTIWSDLHCPWATTVVSRLRKARDQRGLDVVLDQRPWPLELINRQGTPREVVEPEMCVLANHEPEIFSRFDGESWPSTFLPAFELVAAARRVGGPEAAEAADWAVRLRFFRESADVSVRHELEQAARDAGLDADAVMRVWETEPVRADVLADYRRSKDLHIKGSPQVFWADGSASHLPGLKMEIVRGIPRVLFDDPEEPGRLLEASLRDRKQHGKERVSTP
jgi:predicted DsbA family dithiol-disulfide isomerase